MDSEHTANFIADHSLSFGVPVLRNESGGLASVAQPRKYIAEPALSDRNPEFLGKRPTGPDVASVMKSGRAPQRLDPFISNGIG